MDPTYAGLTAAGGAAVGKRLSRYGDKLPGITRGVESQLQHAMSRCVTNLARGADRTKAI